MYSKRIIAANVKRYETHQQRKLTRYSVKACREMVAKLDALLDENGELDRKKRPSGLLKAEREFIRNEIAYCRLDFEETAGTFRSEEHTSELQSLRHLVCRLLLEKKKSCAHWSSPRPAN